MGLKAGKWGGGLHFAGVRSVHPAGRAQVARSLVTFMFHTYSSTRVRTSTRVRIAIHVYVHVYLVVGTRVRTRVPRYLCPPHAGRFKRIVTKRAVFNSENVLVLEYQVPY